MIPRGSSSGFTLVELLVTLALTAMLVSFTIGGIRLAMDGYIRFNADETGFDAQAGLDALGMLIEKTWPATVVDSETGLATPLFAGHRDELLFATLSEGDALEGGLHAVKLSQSCDRRESCILELRTALLRPHAKIDMNTPAVTVGTGVKSMRLRYYGRETRTSPRAEWHDRWLGHDTLPFAVALDIEFGPEPRSPRASIVVRIAHSDK